MASQMMSARRDSRLDFAKGILIVLVVIGHSFFPMETLGKAHLDSFLYKFIYSFHMPAFMLLSGYFFYNSNRKPLKNVLGTKIKSIGVPFLFFNIVIWGLMHLKNWVCSETAAQMNVLRLFSDLYGFVLTSKVMWFLASLLINCFIVGILSRFSYGYIGYIVVFVVSFFIPVDHSYIHPGYLFMFPYFLAGYYIRKKDFSLFALVGKYRIILLLACISLLGLYFYNRDTYIYYTGMNILTENPLYSMCVNVHRFVLGATMTALFFTAVGYVTVVDVNKPGVASMIVKLGQYTLGIYGFQQIMIGVLIRSSEMFGVAVPASYWVVLVIAVLVLGLCYSLARICARFNILSVMFLGSSSGTRS